MISMIGLLSIVLSSSITIARKEEVRWLKYVQQTQLMLNHNTTIGRMPTCSTWRSNNYQVTSQYNRTVRGLSVRGKHCFRAPDCIRGELVFQNNGLSIRQQLESGVRRLVIELHYVAKMKSMLRVCGSVERECKLMKKRLSTRRRGTNWCKQLQYRDYGPHTGCHSGSPDFRSTLKEILNWININQDEFIIVDIIDRVSEEVGCQPFRDVEGPFEMFGDRLYRPNPKENPPGVWPTHQHLVQVLKKNIMFRSTCTFSGEYIFQARLTDYIPVDKFSDKPCPDTQPFSLFYYDQIKVDLSYARRKLSKSRSSIPRSSLGELSQSALRCGTQVALQAMQHRDLFDCSWTWLPYHYGTNCNACTAFSFNPHTKVYGWLNTKCNRQLHVPCRFINGTFSLTEKFHHLPNIGGGDNICEPGSNFTIPFTPVDFHSLALEMWKHGVSTVWLPRVQGITCTDTVRDISCGYPGSPAHGKLLGTNFNFDSRVRYQCKTGWKLQGNVSRVCTSRGKWTGSTPVCTKVNCGRPPTPQNTRQYGKSNYYGSKIGYVCRWSYVFKGRPGVSSVIIACTASGNWSSDVPECVRKTCEVSQWSVWSECSVTCDAGVQTRVRTITSLQNDMSGLHAGCPALSDERYCNVRSCDTCITGEYEAVVEADNCRSAEPIRNRLCVGNCREEGRCCVPTKRRTQRVILFCNGSRPRNYNLQIVEKCGCETCTTTFNYSFKREPKGPL